MADTVEVKLGADVGDAKSSMQDAQSSIAASLHGIQDALQGFGDKNKEAIDAVIENNAKMIRSYADLKDKSTVSFAGMTSAIQKAREAMVTIAAVLAGGAIFKGVVGAALDLEDTVRKLEIVFGMNSKAAQQMAIQLHLAGVEESTYARMAAMVGQRIRTQSEEFDRLKVVIKDAHGQFLPMDQILQNIYKRMQDFKAGTDQDLFVMDLAGRRAVEFASDMQRLNAVHEKAVEMAKKFGDAMGPAQQRDIEKFRQEVNALGVEAEHFGTTIGIAVIPVLEKLQALFHGLTATIPEATARFKASWSAMGAGATDTRSISQYWTDFVANMKKIGPTAESSMRAAADATKAGAASISNSLAQATDAFRKMEHSTEGENLPVPGHGKEGFTTKPTGGADEMEILRNRLKAQQDAFDNMKEAQGSWQTWSEAQTEAFWANVLATEKLTQKERLAVENEMYNARRKVQQEAYQEYIKGLDTERAALGENIAAKIALDQQYYNRAVADYGGLDVRTQELYRKLLEDEKAYRKQQAALAQDALKFNLEVNKLTVQGDEAALKQGVALRQISVEQEYAEEIKLEDRMHALADQEIRDELLRDDLTLRERQSLNEKLVILEIQHQQKISAIKRQAELEQNKDALQASKDFETDFANAIASVVDGTKSLKNAFDDFFRSLDRQLSQIAANQIAKSLFGGGTQGGNFIQTIFSTIFSGTAGAAIPTLAVGTPYVPQDTLAFLHRGEAVVPAAYNKTGAGISGTGNLQVHNHFAISGPIDSRTQDQIASTAAIAVRRAQYRNL